MPADAYPSSSRPRISPGTQLNGIYEIESLIASGGMGDVFKGHAIATGAPVAIKIMRSELAENGDALALFRKEALALGDLHHEAIVRYYVFAVEPTLKYPYLAMELVDGQSLSNLLRRGPLTFEAARALMQRIAAGLQAAHVRGIVHRDVSPDNIIIPGGDVARAKIIDFGIARSTRPGDGTVIGSGFAGKYNYVSPEQLGLFGGDVTAKSDIYSLGLVLAEALTGQPIDMGGSQAEVVEKRRKVPKLGAFDLRFRPLLECMLQPDPARRPDSMATVAAWPLGALSVKTGGGRAGPAQQHDDKGGSGRRGWRYGLAAAALLAIAGGGGGAWYLLQPEVTEKPKAAPRLQEPPRLSTAPEPGGSTVATQTPPAQTAPTPSPPAPAIPPIAALPPQAPPPVSVDPAARIAGYINQYDGGDCFFIMPVAVSETAATIEGYGASVAPFNTLDEAFRRANGFEADIGVRQVTAAQCPAITALGRLRGERATAPRLEVSAYNLRGGESMTGTVDHYGNRQIELLLVSDNGSVYVLTGLLKGAADGRTFNIRMQRTDGGAGAQPQLLMAIATAQPLTSLKIAAPADAAQLFPRMLAEIARSGMGASAAAKYIKLDP
jgi:hypothetical protein